MNSRSCREISRKRTPFFTGRSAPLFVLRLLESSMMNAEVKEGEILPPTIQRLMKGYNKYLRPFFDSKEAAPVRRTMRPRERSLTANKRVDIE